MSYCVYMHECPNGKKYVGVTSKNPNERWKSGHGYRNNKHFYSAIQKYGWDNITHTVLHSNVSKDEAYQLEQKYIREYNSIEYGYNHSIGGDKSSLGFHHTEEARRKIAQAGIGRKRSEKSIQIVSEVKSKSIKCFDLDGNYIKTYKSLREAEKELDIDNSNISAVCTGKYNQIKGYIFRYADDNTAVTKVRCRTKPVNMYSLSNEYIRSFKSIKEASRVMGITDTHITDACRGKYSHSGGYIWRYA